MEKFDLAISYEWEYDIDFVNAVENILQNEGLTTFRISHYNIYETTERVKNRKLHFLSYLDRASDVDKDFTELGEILKRRKCRIFNPYERIEHSTDKASMHLEFITGGLDVPYSIIIPPHKDSSSIKLSLEELAVLGRPFIIKPCNTTGGGIGVVKGAETLKEVLDERKNLEDDKYILQERIVPKYLDGKRAWFRCFWAFGKSFCCWWDDQTHLYSILTREEIELFKLNKLFRISSKIAKICGLDFFSSEIALTEHEKFVVVDYVNDQVDMRFQSKHYDGVPDEIIYQIISQLSRAVKKLNRTIERIQRI
jgi:glutathione synthase/RimK-type ligase-like ATP-grasp enzyme